MYTRNKQGGLDADENYLLERAKKADLVTLPENIEGTNCFNCKFITNKSTKSGFCNHPKIKMLVNGRMCCALWDNKNCYRGFGKKDDKYD